MKISFLTRCNDLYRRYKLLIMFALLIVAIIMPFAIKSDFVRGTMTKTLMYVLLASSLNVINGYSGQFTIGHIGFACIGAYTTAIMTTSLGISFWIAIACSGLLATVFGFLISLPTRKLAGPYLSLVTMGFSEIIRIISHNWIGLTGGPLGIKGIPSPSIFGISLKSSYAYYYLILLLLILMLFVTVRILNSRVGRSWISIRENQSAAASLGIDVARSKSINIMYGAFWAGIAGAFIAAYYHFIDPTMFGLDENFNILTMTIIGGMGTVIGPIIGAVFVNATTELFRSAMEYRLVIYSFFIILMMWIRPQGIAGASEIATTGLKMRTSKEAAKASSIK